LAAVVDWVDRCNRQIESANLLVRGSEVTRPTVQKAIVVAASKPIFGPIRSDFQTTTLYNLTSLVRDKLGVVTRAYFAQRDFSDTSILSDFHSSLEVDLRSKLTESAFYMGKLSILLLQLELNSTLKGTNL
jgi:hypothetical protein